jgi:hypothetical protein
VKGLLLEGPNELKVEFQAAISYDTAKAKAQLPVVLPNGDFPKTTRMYSRKAAY